MKHLLAACAVITLALPAQAASIDSIFSGFAVVGDSLSDNGNTGALLGQLAPLLPPPTPPATDAEKNFARLQAAPGVFSDGFTWARSFTEQFQTAGKTGANLSFAGATIVDNSATGDPVPDLQAQLFAPPTLPFPLPFPVSTYPDGNGGLLVPPGVIGPLPAVNPARTLGDRPLVAVFIGGNDFLNGVRVLDPLAPDFGALGATMAVARGTLEASLQTMALAGVRDFVVMNLPNFAVIPRFIGAPEPFKDELTTIAKTFNADLKSFLEGSNLFGATVTQVDVYGALNDSNATGACVAEVPLTAVDCSGFLFFDDIHPTSAGHAIIADLTRDALEGTYPALVPLPAPLLMLLTALGGFALLRRRA